MDLRLDGKEAGKLFSGEGELSFLSRAECDSLSRAAGRRTMPQRFVVCFAGSVTDWIRRTRVPFHKGHLSVLVVCRGLSVIVMVTVSHTSEVDNSSEESCKPRHQRDIALLAAGS